MCPQIPWERDWRSSCCSSLELSLSLNYNQAVHCWRTPAGLGIVYHKTSFVGLSGTVVPKVLTRAEVSDILSTSKADEEV